MKNYNHVLNIHEKIKKLKNMLVCRNVKCDVIDESLETHQKKTKCKKWENWDKCTTKYRHLC